MLIRLDHLIPVRLNPYCVVWHTAEEYRRLWHGVDREVCEAMESNEED